MRGELTTKDRVMDIDKTGTSWPLCNRKSITAGTKAQQ